MNLQSEPYSVDLKLIDIHRINYITAKVPNAIFDDLKVECMEFIDKNFNITFKPSHKKNLVGAIEKEYLIDATYQFKEFIEAMVRGYHELLNESNESFYINVLRPWVNFQKAGEYNPIHNHSGNLSYVLWINIPYDLSEQQKHPSVFKSNSDPTKVGPTFSFIFPNHLENSFGGIKTYVIPIDKTYEGHIIMFPSHLCHQVTPFLDCDGYRISIAGNIELKYEKKD